MRNERVRDAIRQTMAETFMADTNSTWLYDKGYLVTDAVLAMPEMQAIKRCLIAAYVDYQDGEPNAESMICDGLHESVIAWLLEKGKKYEENDPKHSK